jgi:hypothetical protein
LADCGTDAYVKPTTFVTLNTRARITIGINLRNRLRPAIEESLVETHEKLNLMIETISNTTQSNGNEYSAIWSG